MATPIRIKRSAVPGKRPTVDQLQLGELALNTYDAEIVTIRDRFAATGIATEVVRLGAGTTVTNVLYVTKDGNDNNTGKKLGDAKATIQGAVAIAEKGSVIRVSSGSYIENNPIILGEQVSIIGDSLREVSITPQNADQDLIYVSEGNYLSEISFTGTMNSGKSVVAFNPNKVGFSSQSPYISNCTNFIANSIGMKIDGNHVIGPYKSMVTDAYTQYNSNGIGCSITNEGYAQIVSMFNINNDIAVYAGSGGQCDLTNSNSSFGNFGLVADNVGPKKITGINNSEKAANSSEFEIDLSVTTFTVNTATYDKESGITTLTTSVDHDFEVGMSVVLADLEFVCSDEHAGVTTTIFPDGTNGDIFEVTSVPSSNELVVNVGPSTIAHTYTTEFGSGNVKINATRPFDGQVVFFDDLFKNVQKINVTDGGSGYTQPPEVTISSPSVDWGIPATAVAGIANGSVSEINIVSGGRGYESTPTVTIEGSATASAVITEDYYVISKATPISNGISTITVTENVPYAVGVGTTVPFFKRSSILASSHSFEYIGSGVDLINSLPSRGGVGIQENEIDNKNGGLVIFTSTDQAGNFRIGEGVQINQQNGTLSGESYTKSLFSTMTPFILALGGD